MRGCIRSDGSGRTTGGVPRRRRVEKRRILSRYVYGSAAVERARILERQREGIALAKAKGKYHGGRSPKLGTTGTANGPLMMYAVYSGSLSAASRSAHYSVAFDV